MRKVGTIFRKELLDTLRDRRTLLMMVVIPLALYPVLITVFSRVEKSRQAKERVKELNIAFIDNGQGADLMDVLKSPLLNFNVNGFDEFDQVSNGDTALLRELIREEKVDGALILGPAFNAQLDSLEAAEVQLIVKSTEQSTAERRLQAALEVFKENERTERFEQLSLDPGFTAVLDVNRENLATTAEQIGIIGAILPYFFIVFCLMGSMYPAIDLGAGEKERGTIETLITSPASRIEILVGKLGVVIVAGLASAMLSVVGIVIAIANADESLGQIVDILTGIVQGQTLILILLMLIPLAVFFASLLLSISIYARSFKEAQSMITPLFIVIIMPAIIGMIPGMELNAVTAAIPVLNVTLGTKAIVAGTITTPLYLETMITLLALAAIGILGSIQWFAKESNILRG